jgi:bifunctional DNA-binding transcriptional regulator/antitoxin component of YhaV-PrlF toxin-antitoxin module
MFVAAGAFRRSGNGKSWTRKIACAMLLWRIGNFMEGIYRARLNEEGRLSIPASYRKRHGLGPGQEVMLKETDDGLLMTTFDRALRQFQQDVAALVGPGVSLADELIAERRSEAAQEHGE